MSEIKTVGIIGNPNVGKTYLFNRLTACVGCVGNWSGVTSTTYKAQSCGQDRYTILDLPGCHHLSEGGKGAVTDGQKEIEALLDNSQVDLWLNVLDVDHLQRQLFLTVQLLEARQNVILVLNRVDLLPGLEKEIDIKALSDCLQVPIVKVSAKLGLGIRALQSTVSSQLKNPAERADMYPVQYPPLVEQLLDKRTVPGASRRSAWKKMMDAESQSSPPAWHFDPQIAKLLNSYGSMTDIMVLTRHKMIERWCHQSEHAKGMVRGDVDKVLDGWFLHKWLGLPLFFLLMFAVFWISMGIGQLLQGVLEPLLQLLAIQVPTLLIQHYELPFYVEVCIAQGIGLSLVTALSFFPVLLVMFFALHMLEESGYMTRAAVVMDRIMRALNLPGESMVALVLGLGCNVPGILATRHIPRKSDKIVTALMMPFMSCGARLTIFAVFASVFFPQRAASVLFFLYVLGISIAFVTGLLARYAGLVKERGSDGYLLEIPAYQWPSLSMGLQQAWRRSQRFVWRALGVIMPVCLVLALCNHVSTAGQILVHPGDQSILACLGKSLSLVFYPIGLEKRHWPLVVSLLMGLLAKEVVITTLSVFYTQMNTHTVVAAQGIDVLLRDCMTEIVGNIGHWYAYFIPSMSTDMPAWAPYLNLQNISADAVMGYLIFTLLYFPCVSTLYATARQVGWRWAGISVLWSTAAAYICAGTYLILSRYMNQHIWGVVGLAVVLLLLYGLKEVVKTILAHNTIKKSQHTAA